MQDSDFFTVNFVTVVPFFKVTENFPIGGTARMGRRDLRGGRQAGSAARVAGGVRVNMEWGDPLAGGFGWTRGREGGSVEGVGEEEA